MDEKLNLKPYYFTFGWGQPNQGHYIKVWAEDEVKARTLMFKNFGPSWAFSYTEEEWLKSATEGCRFYNMETPLEYEITQTIEEEKQNGE